MVANYTNKVTDEEYNLFMTLMHVSVSKHLFDEHFTVIWANNYFYELIGYKKEEYEALYHNHVDEYFKDDPEAVTKMVELITAAYKRQDGGCEFECRMHVKNKKDAWIRVTCQFTDEVQNGAPVIYTIYTDITNLKEMQFELEERSRLLCEALESAKKANQAKSDFLSRMSHDIRTPMNAIIGMTNIATSHLDNPAKIQDCLKKISLSSQHLLGLINDVLDMSKIESGKMTLNNGNMSLPGLLENIVTIIQTILKEKKQEFSIRPNKVKHEHFYCDSLRLRQVFINLLSNAIKFTPENGKITFDIEELPSDQPGTAWFKFTVTDTGIGIKPEFITHIFDAFTREKDSRIDKTEGSGLGMAITKKIVDTFGGSIEVESQVGKGSAFTICLPLEIDKTQGGELKCPQFPGLRILMVDDDEIMCEYTMEMLTKLGICCDWVNNSDDALDKIKKATKAGTEYHAVILDWQMPGRNGIQTARLIRQLTNDKLPIMLISAYDWSEIEEDALSAGISGFLPKPIFLSTLCRGIQKYVLQESETPFEDETAKQYDFTGKRFLLAEDNELNREIAIELLSAIGAQIEYACNGAEAVAKFEQAPEHYYDLILMDIQMPVMNGYTATREIRRLPRKDAAAIPILAMTADAFAEDIKAAHAAGMNGHLAKPLDISVINREIDKILKQE